jgi:hypothetical protein
MSRDSSGLRGLAGPLAAAVLACAGTVAPGHAETTGAFPNLDPWPRALALSGLTAGLGHGVEAVLENPASMLHEPARGVGFSHAALFDGGLVRHQSAAICWVRYQKGPAWEGGEVVHRRGGATSAYGLGVTNLRGELPGSDSYGELEVALAYTRHVTGGLRAGLRGRALQARSTVDGSDGGGFALDVGVEGVLSGFRAGATLRSLVSEIRWDRANDEPLLRAIQFALEAPFGRGARLIAGGSIRSAGRRQGLGVAGEWKIPGVPLALRGGPAVRYDGFEPRAEWSAGIGFQSTTFDLDYGVRTGPPGLGEIHRFGLVASFR